MFVTHDKYIETADEILDRFNDHRIDTVEGMRVLKILQMYRDGASDDVADEIEIASGGIKLTKKA